MAYWTASRSGSPINVAVGVMTGVSVVISTFLALALVQVGHAIIDIAENTGAMVAKGQMLPEQKSEPQMQPLEAGTAGGLRAIRHKL